MDMGLDMDIIGFGLGMLIGGGLDMLSGSGPGGHLGLQRLVLLSLRKAEWVQNPLKGKWIFLDAWPGSAPASIEP